MGKVVPLRVKTAEIKTGVVDIRMLTVNGKQVTLAVFRQMDVERLVNDDGTLNGIPWGRVNYHPDKCGDGPEHWHIVSQMGEELVRSAVCRRPKDGSPYGDRPTFTSKNGSAALDAKILELLKAGVTRDDLRKLLLLTDDWLSLPETGSEPIAFRPYQQASTVARRAISISARDQGDVIGDYLMREEEWQRAYLPAWVKSDGADYDERRQAEKVANAGRTYGVLMAALLRELEEIVGGRTAEELQAAFVQDIKAEVEKREKYLASVQALGNLPHLYIAV